MKTQIKLGKRLCAIAEFLTLAQPSDEYRQIWDCCCDHGYLGIYLLECFAEKNNHAVQINFVDQITHITKPLSNKLSQSNFHNYKVFTLNAEHLEFDQNKRHCIIISGVTTTGTLRIIQAMLNNHPNQSLDFILCPTRGQYDLRQYLIEKDFHLIEEAYIKENGRHYELLFVRSSHKDRNEHRHITSIGEFWQRGNEEHLSYLKNRTHYYQQEVLDASKFDAIKANQLYSQMLQNIIQENNH